MSEVESSGGGATPRVRLVLDTNVLITAVLSPRGPGAQLVRRAVAGEVEMFVSEKLLDELDETLQRDKFRRWLTLDEVGEYVAIVRLLSTEVADRPDDEVPQVCADPDDNYLVALYQDVEAQILVSGDRRVQEIDYANVEVCSPREALDSVGFEHEWGPGYLPGSVKSAERQIAAEGSTKIIDAYRLFATIVAQPDAENLLHLVVVPGTLPAFRRGLREIRDMIAGKGLASRPIYASPDIAYLKLPPDAGTTLRTAGEVVLPPGTILATMQHCPDLTDPPGLDIGQWRVFGIGHSVDPEEVPPRPHH